MAYRDFEPGITPEPRKPGIVQAVEQQYDDMEPETAEDDEDDAVETDAE